MTLIAGTPTPVAGERSSPAGVVPEPALPFDVGPTISSTIPTESGEASDQGDEPVAAPAVSDAPFEGLRPGDVILDRYRLVKPLGHGGMGTVFLAEEDLTGQRVAIKSLPPSLMHERGIRDRFRAEAQALAALDHPHIVPLVTYAEHGNTCYLVMKYVEGVSVDALVEKEKRLDFDLARQIFSDVVDALGYAHARGVIHRDVKPANVLLAEDGRVYLVDFGIAKKEASTKLTQTGMLMGTPQYMSPEQISGHPVDRRSDLYAAGLLLYEMLTGRPPFVSDRTFAILKAHVESPPPDPEKLRGEKIPTDLLVVTKRLLEKKPDRRPPTAEAALELMRNAASSPAVAEPMPTPLTTELEPDEIALALGHPRRGWLALAGAALSLGLVAGIAFAVMSPVDWEGEFDASVEDAMTDAEALAAEHLFGETEEALERGEPDRAQVLLEALPENARTSQRGMNLAFAIALEREDVAAARAGLAALEGLPADEQPVALPELRAAVDDLARRVASATSRPRKRNGGGQNRRRYADLSNAQIEKVTLGEKSRVRIQECWERTTLREDPTARGQVHLQIEIKPSGRVKSARVASQTVGGADLSRCMTKVARAWVFPAYRGDPIVVTQVFDLVPRG